MLWECAVRYHLSRNITISCFCLAWALIHYPAATIRLLNNFYTWANYLCWERLISSLLTASLRKYNYGRNTNWLCYNLATKKLVHFCNSLHKTIFFSNWNRFWYLGYRISQFIPHTFHPVEPLNQELLMTQQMIKCVLDIFFPKYHTS